MTEYRWKLNQYKIEVITRHLYIAKYSILWAVVVPLIYFLFIKYIYIKWQKLVEPANKKYRVLLEIE